MTMSKIEKARLVQFLTKARAETYSADDETRICRLEEGGQEASFEEGELSYRDRWYGGAHFTGIELVWQARQPIWSMTFHGMTLSEVSTDFPHFHKRALRRMPVEAPFRGPAFHREGELVYVNDWTGSIDAFRGAERMFQSDREVFRLEYQGGSLD
jgi:hypothetical protein